MSDIQVDADGGEGDDIEADGLSSSYIYWLTFSTIPNFVRSMTVAPLSEFSRLAWLSKARDRPPDHEWSGIGRLGYGSRLSLTIAMSGY